MFLNSGAIWCHIKLDRDERPDIDRIYQQAVAAMGSGGGWPLTVVDFYHSKKDEISEYVMKLMYFLKPQHAMPGTE